jgi:hypothetical protein
MRLALGILGIVLILIGLFFVLEGFTVAAGIGWGNDVDLDTGGKALVGFIFGAGGLALGVTGWAALVKCGR